MMYLSRVEIDSQDRKKIRDLDHVGAYHNWVEQSFPKEIASQERTRKLWRVDTLGQKDYLLIVSETYPDIERLEQYGVPGTGQTKDYSKFINQIEDGLVAQFRISLNPVVSLYQGKGSKRGRVVPHVTIEQQEKFLLDRSEKNGFHLNEGEFAIVDRGYVLLKKAGQKDLRLSKATYQGILRVTDAKQFKETLTKGFGKKKAYGFGMMTIIPLEDK